MARMDGERKSPHRIEISATQLVAGSAAAACGAWLASKIGLAGTVIGAAVVSAIVTLLSAIYAQGVRRARAQLLLRREMLRARPTLPASYAEPTSPVSEHEALPGEPDGSADKDELDELETTRTLVLPAFQLEDSGGYRWGRIALAALAVFVVAMLVVTVIELINGHSLQCTTSGRNCDQGTTLIPIKHPTPSPTKTSTQPSPTSTPTPKPSVSGTSSATPSDTTSPTGTPTGSATPTPSGTTTVSSAPPAG